MVTRVPSETHENQEHTPHPCPTDAPLRLTLAPWRVSGREKIFARSGHVSQYLYGTCATRESQDEQLGIVLSPQSGTLVVDVDSEEFDDTALGEYLADHQPISTRGALGGLPNRHYLVDMRALYAQGRYVRQGPIVGGDVKANGFVPAPGCVHPSGDRYEPVLDMAGGLYVVECDEQLFGLLVAARASAPRAGGGAHEGGVGQGQEPQLFSLTGRLVGQGLSREQAWPQWLAAARAFTPRDPAWPWTEADRPVFEGHWQRCTAMEQENYPGVGPWQGAAPQGAQAEAGGAEGEGAQGGSGGAQAPDAPGVDWAAPDALGSPQEPMVGARALQGAVCTGAGGLLVRRFWRGSFHAWSGGRWQEVPDADVNAELYQVAEHARYSAANAEGGVKIKPWAPTTPKITNLRNALAAVLNTSDTVEMPAWLDGRDEPRLVALRDCLVDPMTGASQGHTAAYFNGYALDFAYDPAAQCPAWRGFLESVWPGDEDSRMLLAQWFGYVLSGRTDLQKLMYLKGLPRSGKGTIARILAALLGSANVCGPTFDSFGGGFGLELMVKAQLAVVGDARFTGDQKVMQAAISKILSITGEDRLNVDRKYKTAWSGTLPTRLMLLSNEMPWFRDSSSAIVDRMLLLIFKESFVGREDLTLELRLRAELAGIFNWALEGYRELVIADGRFVRPTASGEVLTEFRESVSPIEAWLEAECHRGRKDDLVASGALYQKWIMWCEENGHKPGGVNGFLRLVQTVWPSVSRYPILLTNAEGKRVKAWSGIRYTGPEG